MPKTTKCPISFFGGKQALARWIVAHFPPHRTYVEAFGGGASVLLSKPPSHIEVYNDINADVVNFYRVLRDPETFGAFRLATELTPYSRDEYYAAIIGMRDEEANSVERARRFFVVGRMAVNGGGVRPGGWSYDVSTCRRGMSKVVSAYLSAVEGLQMVHERLALVQIDSRDFRIVLRAYDTEETLFYLDPPYHPQARTQTRYVCDMTISDHDDLVDILLDLRGTILLSGYANPSYARLEEAGWAREDKDVTAPSSGGTRPSAGGGRGRRMESLWISPGAQRRRT